MHKNMQEQSNYETTTDRTRAINRGGNNTQNLPA
jgi:hypothetical protein